MDLKFEWYDREAGAPSVTLAEYGLVFNAAAVRAMDEPARVALGFDKERRVLGVRAAEYLNLPESKTYPFAERFKRGFVRLNSKDFIRYLAQFLPHLDLARAQRFVARWDEAGSMLIVDLNQKVGESSESSAE